MPLLGREKIHHNPMKRIGGFGMNPMTGAGNCHQVSVGEYFFDGGPVAVLNVVGPAAADETSRFVDYARGHDWLGQLMIILRDSRKAYPPAKPAVALALDIFQ